MNTSTSVAEWVKFDGELVESILAAQGRRKVWLAERIGVIPMSVSRYLRGDPLPLDRARLAAEALGVPLSLILRDPLIADSGE